jgi:hypothetical protein
MVLAAGARRQVRRWQLQQRCAVAVMQVKRYNLGWCCCIAVYTSLVASHMTDAAVAVLFRAANQLWRSLIDQPPLLSLHALLRALPAAAFSFRSRGACILRCACNAKHG